MGILNGNKTLSMDFGTGSVKCVEGVYSKKGVLVKKSFTIDLPENVYNNGEIQDMDQMVYLLRTGLTQNGVSSGSTYCVVNSTSILIREVKLPRVTDEEIEAILNYQLGEYIPVNPEDYVVKFITIGEANEDGIEKVVLMLVGIPRTIVTSHLTLVNELSLKPEVLDYHGNAIGKLIVNGGTINSSIDNSGTVACIDLGGSNTAVTIVEAGIVKVSRIIEKGMNDIFKEIEKVLPQMDRKDILLRLASAPDVSIKPTDNSEDSLLVEAFRDGMFSILEAVEMIFRYYRSRDISNSINSIVLYGGVSKQNGVEKLCTSFFNVDTDILTTLANVRFDGDLNTYANAIGGLIRISEVKRK